MLTALFNWFTIVVESMEEKNQQNNLISTNSITNESQLVDGKLMLEALHYM
jgi:hypothetical protein